MGIEVGMVGVGSFAQGFIPLFKAHPLVDRVVLCDLDAELLRQNAERHGIPDTCPSLDDLCASGVDAVVLITQNWLHAPQAVQALEAGKHTWSAVPAGIAVDEVEQLVQAVERSGRIYMLAETSYYYPAVLYCRDRYRRGDFGRAVYAEAEYYHDFDHGLYEVMQRRGGARWRETAAGPPMHYPTHSTSQIVSVTGAHMTAVSCLGFVDQHEDGLFRADVNRWGNVFSNQSALFAMSDGSACRINEFRRVGHPGTVRMSLWGTAASFEENTAGAVWLSRDAQATQDLGSLLACTGVPARPSGEAATPGLEHVTADDGTHRGAAAVHPVHRLPPTFAGLPNGHNGSHQFLVDDFVRACAEDKLPPNHVWAAARYTVPGMVAHESAVRGGAQVPVPDFGDAPANAPRLELE
ncbi:MAG: Gfo/Idh/MocA family oxidoreductase [Gemmatimonadota bacterium]